MSLTSRGNHLPIRVFQTDLYRSAASSHAETSSEHRGTVEPRSEGGSEVWRTWNRCLPRNDPRESKWCPDAPPPSWFWSTYWIVLIYPHWSVDYLTMTSTRCGSCTRPQRTNNRTSRVAKEKNTVYTGSSKAHEVSIFPYLTRTAGRCFTMLYVTKFDRSTTGTVPFFRPYFVGIFPYIGLT